MTHSVLNEFVEKNAMQMQKPKIPYMYTNQYFDMDIRSC